jgi:DNA-binding NarL/FixJ family response regulator
MNKIRVLLVDDHPVVRNGIRNLLLNSGDIEIVGEAANGSEALELAQSADPEVILLDMELPDIQGTQVARTIQARHTAIKILALSAHDDAVYIRELLELGASGYLMKEEAPEHILEAIRGVAHGDKGWVSRTVSAQMAAWVELNSQSGQKLTPREEAVLRLVVDGKTNQAIAADLGISEKTVEKYMGEIFSKLNVASRVEAAVYAVRAGLV